MEDKKLKGNAGEIFVNELAYKSLLKYWCYPNPIDENGDKKEVCDLLVLFKDICIIISVKNYKFDGNYERYNRKTVEKATRQIVGAERKLFEQNREIYIKHPDRSSELFQKGKYSNVFRIIVNLGEGVEVYVPSVKTLAGKFITVFDKDTFELLLDELDTINDFTKYLVEREVFINHYDSILSFSHEKDIFALYLRNGKTLLSADKDILNAGLIILDIEGEWDRFCEEYKLGIEKRNEENRPSHLFDEFLEKQLTQVDDGVLLAQEFLSMDRFRRRMFSKLFSEFLNLYDHEKTGTTAFRYFELEQYGIVFFYFSPDLINTGFPDRGLETAMVGHVINSDYSKKKMLGLAVTSELKKMVFKFIDFGLPVEDSVFEDAKEAMKQLGWFTNLKFKRYDDKELFPGDSI